MQLPIEIEKSLKEFDRSFEDYGLSHLAEKARETMQEQYTEHKINVTLKPYLFYMIESNAKRKWNQQVFKNNYLAWLRRFADTLNRIDKSAYPWISKKEILEPFLKIKWDDVKVVGFFEELKYKYS